MFERRLKLLMFVLALPVIAICARLVHLQVFGAGQYRAGAERMLLCPVREFPFIRGDITDHEGRRLAFDDPSWDVCVHYGLLSGNKAYLRTIAQKRYPQLKRDQALAALQKEIPASWTAISSATGVPAAELEARCERIRKRVAAQKKSVERSRRMETVIEEEQMTHAVVEGLDQSRQVAAREQLSDYEWIEIVGAQRRRYLGGEALGHLLGRMREVGPDRLPAQKPQDVIEELSSYALRDRYGVTGCEALGERHLRGQRGRLRENMRGERVVSIEPRNGLPMRLTIDLPLQQAVYERLIEAVKATPLSTGGCAIVLDIPSREILAMVDFPSVDPALSEANLQKLGDERDQPALFRCVRAAYPPGSTVKPMLLAGALQDAAVTPSTRVHCDGMLIHDPPGWRCTGIHLDVDPLKAIQHSCNIFFCRLGEHEGVEKLAWWMSQFGFGATAGTGLPEERTGRLPVLRGLGASRNAAIGQGDTLVTPIQLANMTATLASGVHRPVTLWADDPAPRPARRIDINEDAWRIVREGMYKTVNEVGGTGYENARLVDQDDFILIGKTGSAQASRIVTERLFTCHLKDGTTVEKSARNLSVLRQAYPGAEIVPGQIVGRWPPPEQEPDPTHAWFIGYLTTRQHYLDTVNGGKLNVAVVVLIEYGGHGGGAAGPVARDIIQDVIRRQRGEALDEE